MKIEQIIISSKLVKIGEPMVHELELALNHTWTEGQPDVHEQSTAKATNVTDGAPRDYKEVYEKYNWPNKLVRIFSYLIGKEIIDTTATKTISCANKGRH